MSGIKIGSAVLVASLLSGFALPAVAEGPAPELTLGSVALNVADLARAEKYYAEVFGFKKSGQYPPEGKAIELFLSRHPDARGGATLILARLNDDPLPAGKSRYGRLIINTPHADALAKRAEAAGSTGMRRIKLPGDSPPVIIFFNDLDGYEIELYQAPK